MIGAGTPAFSPDGKRIAYAATKGKKWLVVADGQPGPEYDECGAGTPVFSPDGKRVAYSARKGGKQLVVVDGQPGPEYDIISVDPVFDAGGSARYMAVKKRHLYRVKETPN